MPQLAVAAWSTFTAAATATAATLTAVGIGSTLATAIGYAVTAAKVASGVMSVASQLGYGAQKEPSLASQWAQNKLTIEASPPRTIAVGRTALAGALRAHFQTGRNGDIFSQIIALSGAGPIESIEGVVIERQNYSINTSTNQVSYAPNDFWMTYRLGDWAQSSLPTNFNGYALDAITQWTSTHKGAGIAHAMIAMRASDKAFPKGRPQPLVLVKGHTELIDPRTGTTATAAHRDNPAVWEYSWRLGLKSPPAYGSVRLGGFFKDVSQLYTADYAAWANVCTSNGWKVSGEINLNNDDREAVSRAICQAGGAVPITKSGKDSVFYSSPKTSVGTISSSDIFGELDIQYSPEIRDRINGIVPKFRSEAHGWEIVPGSLVTSSSYISEDGGTRVGDLQFDLVNLSAQAGQLAAYKVIQARERLFITGQFHPRVLDYEIGEAVTIDFPEYDLSGIKCIIEGRDTGASGAIKLALRSETDSKHPWALGQTITVPDTTLPQLSDGTLSAPSSSAWTKTAVTISSGNTQIPIIRLTGAAESSRVKKILVDYRVSPSGGWKSLPAFDASITDIEIDNVTPSTLYEIRIAYQSESGFVSSYTSLGTVNTGTFVAGEAANVDWGGVTGTGKPQDYANKSNPNLWRFSNFNNRELHGWSQIGDGCTIAGYGVNITGQWAGGDNYLYLNASGSLAPTARMIHFVNFANAKTCVVGEYIYPSLYVAGDRIGTIRGEIIWWDKDGNGIGYTGFKTLYVGQYARNITGASCDNRNNMTRLAPDAAIQVPALVGGVKPARWSFWISFYGNNEADPYGFISCPMTETARSSQTSPSPFVHGLDSYENADVTGSNTAAAITGQGTGATANNLTALNPGEGAKLTGIAAGATVGATTGTNLVSPTYGTLVDSQIKTDLGTAAAISGQGALATLNNVGTLQISANAVSTIQDTGYFTPTVGTANTWVQVGSKSINSTGQPVRVDFAVFAQVTATAAPAGHHIGMRIKRGSTILFDRTILEASPLGPDGGGNYYPLALVNGFSFFLNDTPSAGTYTYTMELYFTSLSYCVADTASIILTELKR